MRPCYVRLGWVAVEFGVGRQEVGFVFVCPHCMEPGLHPGRRVMPMLATAKSFPLYFLKRSCGPFE